MTATEGRCPCAHATFPCRCRFLNQHKISDRIVREFRWPYQITINLSLSCAHLDDSMYHKRIGMHRCASKARASPLFLIQSDFRSHLAYAIKYSPVSTAGGKTLSYIIETSFVMPCRLCSLLLCLSKPKPQSQVRQTRGRVIRQHC